MEERDKEVIRHMYVRLEKNLEATSLLSYLYQEHVLSEEEVEKIKTKKTSKTKAAKLLKIMKRRKTGLKMLIKALLVTEIQAFLGHELLERVTWSEEEIESLKLEVEGKVDASAVMELKVAALQQKINHLVARQEKMKNDYEKTIKELNHKVLEYQMKLDELTSSGSGIHSGIQPSSTADHGSTHGFFSWAFRKQDPEHHK